MEMWRWFAVSAVALSACGSSTTDPAAVSSSMDEPAEATSPKSDFVSTATSTDPTTADDVPQSSVSDQAHEVDHRVLVDGASTGGTWVTALATNSNALTQLWAEIGLPDDVPVVDFVESVVVYFGPAESGSCRSGPLSGVAYDAEVGRIYPVIDFEVPTGGGEERVCTDDANPHAIVVAIPRVDVPDDDFEVWVERNDPPACCAADATPVEAGELAMFDPTDRSGPRYGSRPPADRLGEEIGSGSTGPPLASPRPWPINTIYTDQTPGALVVEFTPPDPGCIAATANAVIGRADAILVRLRVDDSPDDGGCADGAAVNQVLVPLDEPLGDRRIYTLLADELPDTGAFADDLADSVIGLDLEAATAAIRATGYTVRVVDSAELESDFDPTRMNLWVDDGIVTFAQPF